VLDVEAVPPASSLNQREFYLRDLRGFLGLPLSTGITGAGAGLRFRISVEISKATRCRPIPMITRCCRVEIGSGSGGPGSGKGRTLLSAMTHDCTSESRETVGTNRVRPHRPSFARI
jgi:hypothetical protein